MSANDLQRYKRADSVGTEGVQAVYGDLQKKRSQHIHHRNVPLAETAERTMGARQNEARQDCDMDNAQPSYRPKSVGYSL